MKLQFAVIIGLWLEVRLIDLQNAGKQIKTKQNKTKQNKTKQNKTKQNKTKQKTNPQTKLTSLLENYEKRTQDFESKITTQNKQYDYLLSLNETTAVYD